MTIRSFSALLLAFAGSALLFAQSSTADSLAGVIQALPNDSLRVVKYNELALKFLRNEPKLAQKYAEAGLALAEDTDNKEGLATAYYVNGVLAHISGNIDEALDYYTSSLQLCKMRNYQGLRAKVLIALGNASRDQHDIISAKVYFRQSYEIALQLNDSIMMASILNNLANSISDDSTQKAVEYLTAAASIFERKKSYINYISAISNIALICIDEKLYDEALQYCDKAFAANEQHGDSRNKGLIYLRYQEVKNGLNQYDQAIAYGQKALAIFREIEQGVLLAECLSVLSISYIKIKDFENAEKYLVEAIGIARKVENFNFLSLTILKVGEMYFVSEEYDRALASAYEALNIARMHQYIPQMATANMLAGKTLLAQKKYAEAVAAFEECSLLVKTNDLSPAAYLDIYQGMAQAYAKLDQPAAADRNTALYETLKATLQLKP